MSEQQAIAAQEAIGTYAANQVANASPGQLIVILYDYTIGCCRRGDMLNAKRGLVELSGALDLTYLDVAGPLFRIYEYLLDVVRAGRFDEAQGTLEQLRASWIEAMAKAGTAPAPREWTEA